MAKATANCTCKECGKHFEKVKILRNCKEAESWQKWAEDNIDMCPECWRDARRAEERAAIDALRTEYDAPPMTGSDKQIAWAEEIQLRAVQAMRDYVDNALSISSRELADGKITEAVHQERIDQNDRYIRYLFTETRASWWIDRRDKYELDVCRELVLRGVQIGHIKVPDPNEHGNKGV